MSYMTDSDLIKIFNCEKLNSLLSPAVACYPLSNSFKSYFITNRLYYKSNISKVKKTNLYVPFFKNVFYILYMLFLFVKNSEKKKKYGSDVDILTVSRERVVDVKTAKGKIFSDYLFWPIFQHIKGKKPELKCLHLVKSYKVKNEIDQVEQVDLSNYISLSIIMKSYIFNLKTLFIWFVNRRKIFDYLKKVNCSYFSSLLDAFFFKKIPYLIFMDFLLCSALKSIKPKVILANDDVLSLKPIFCKDVKFFVLQSALMNGEHEGIKEFFYKKFDMKRNKNDFFLVSGKEYKKIKNKTDTDTVVVTGQPRYDLFYYANELYSKEIFCKKYDIPLENKIVLWTTQCHGLTNGENSKNFEVVFKAMIDIKNVTLVIKQHPAEGNEYTKLINEIKTKYDLTLVVVPKNSDTSEQISVCDVLITKSSTTAKEAVSLDKPVLILNLGDRPDRVDYVEQGVAAGVYKPEDFKPTLEKLLKDDTSLAKNRDKYIEKYLYKIDGKSTERVVGVLKRSINN
jgi:hypothetical protein